MATTKMIHAPMLAYTAEMSEQLAQTPKGVTPPPALVRPVGIQFSPQKNVNRCGSLRPKKR